MSRDVTGDELPEGWAKAPLAQIVDVLDSKRVPLNADERERRIKGKAEQDLVPYYGATGQVGFIDDAIFDEPLILLGEDGVPFFDPLRHKAYRVSGRSWVNNHAHVLRARPEVANQRYVTAFLNSFNYTGYVSGSTRLKLTQGSMNSIPVTLAPLAEQKRIADKLEAVLGRVDACRARLDRVPALLKRFRQSVLAAATSGKLTEEWRVENGVDAEWETIKLGGLLTDIRYGTAKKCRYEPIATPVLRIPNIGDGHVTLDDIKFAEFDQKEIRTLALKPGDLLVIRSNGSVELVGRIALVSEREDGYLYAGYLIRLRIDGTRAIPSYVALSLRNPATRAVIELNARSSSGVNNINTEEIKALAINLPSLPEQQEIVRRVEALVAFADRIEARLATARKTVDRLTPATLAKAFRGELVPQDPADEPASALLERLCQEQGNPAAAKPKRVRRSPEAAS